MRRLRLSPKFKCRKKWRGVRQEVREVEGESKVEESRSLHEHVDDMTGEDKIHYLSHGACARGDVTMC